MIFLTSLNIFLYVTYFLLLIRKESNEERNASSIRIDPHESMITRAQVNWICDQYEKSKYGQRVSKLIEYSCAAESSELPAIFSQASLSPKDFKKARTLTQLRWLMWRTYVDSKKNSASLLLRFITYMVRYQTLSYTPSFPFDHV